MKNNIEFIKHSKEIKCYRCNGRGQIKAKIVCTACKGTGIFKEVDYHLICTSQKIAFQVDSLK